MVSGTPEKKIPKKIDPAGFLPLEKSPKKTRGIFCRGYTPKRFPTKKARKKMHKNIVEKVLYLLSIAMSH